MAAILKFFKSGISFRSICWIELKLCGSHHDNVKIKNSSILYTAWSCLLDKTSLNFRWTEIWTLAKYFWTTLSSFLNLSEIGTVSTINFIHFSNPKFRTFQTRIGLLGEQFWSTCTSSFGLNGIQGMFIFICMAEFFWHTSRWLQILLLWFCGYHQNWNTCR